MQVTCSSHPNGASGLPIFISVSVIAEIASHRVLGTYIHTYVLQEPCYQASPEKLNHTYYIL